MPDDSGIAVEEPSGSASFDGDGESVDGVAVPVGSALGVASFVLVSTELSEGAAEADAVSVTAGGAALCCLSVPMISSAFHITTATTAPAISHLPIFISISLPILLN
ncbi:hypothetical protein OMP38_06975 [Cohnella ginsengisoli]|uniref:Uncharacterized protein n=1 Tax=Cohnella ginsengisoli TaxID=425004 RepID=A0A9X4QLS5_9BACL|nr:hypothetical protein [Cohnella ginsengisoli]MDG0790626.1 hypothetical protein [Cohnella ginsengisoli]